MTAIGQLKFIYADGGVFHIKKDSITNAITYEIFPISTDLPATPTTQALAESTYLSEHTILDDLLAAYAAFTATKGQPLGLATLGSDGKYDVSLFPGSMMGNMHFVDVWNANTNSPSLASGTGTAGNFYIVNVAGTTTLDGISTWSIGDWAVYEGSVWRKIDNSAMVSSFKTRTGAIVPTTGDYNTDQVTEGSTNLYFTNARAVSALSTQLAVKADTTAVTSAIGAAISGLLNGAGAAYDTLKELQDIIVNDETTATALATTVAKKPNIFVGAAQKTASKAVFKTFTITTAGTATFQLTDDNTSTGNALFANVYDESINLSVNDATASYQMGWSLSVNKKTLTVTINKLTTANILTGILGQATAPTGTVVRLQVWGD